MISQPGHQQRLTATPRTTASTAFDTGTRDTVTTRGTGWNLYATMKITDLIVETAAKCTLCDEWHWLTASINIQEPTELETACEAIHVAIMEEARLDGWKGNYCPECVETKANRIKELEQADMRIREYKDNQ